LRCFARRARCGRFIELRDNQVHQLVESLLGQSKRGDYAIQDFTSGFDIPLSQLLDLTCPAEQQYRS
jgi:hypothetical protein